MKFPKKFFSSDMISGWHFYALIAASYYLVWLLPRLPAIYGFSLHFDDFNIYAINIERTFCNVPPPDYRWVTFGLLCALEKTIPDWSAMVWPKLLAGGFIALFATLIARQLVKWSIPILIAFFAPIFFISHPIINEISLWNTTMPFPLWLSLTVIIYDLVGLDRSLWTRSLGGLLMIIVVLAYEIYLSFFLVLILAEVVFLRLEGKPIDWPQVKNRLLFFISIAIFYIIQVSLTKWYFGITSGRGLVEITSFSSYFDAKMHGIFNLVVNCYMPIIAYYSGIEFAWSAWKWIPLSMSGMILLFGFLARRPVAEVLALFAFSLILPVVPTLPLLLASQSAESWRVSVPVLVAVILVFVLLMTLVWQAVDRIDGKGLIGAATIKAMALVFSLGILIIEMPVTHAEAKLRAFEANADRSLSQFIEGYWLARGLTKDNYHVGVITSLDLPAILPDEQQRASQLSVAYHQRGRSSALEQDYSWRGFLMLHDFKPIELNDSESGVREACANKTKHCRLDLTDYLSQRCRESPDFIHPGNGLRLVHLAQEKITVVCR